MKSILKISFLSVLASPLLVSALETPVDPRNKTTPTGDYGVGLTAVDTSYVNSYMNTITKWLGWAAVAVIAVALIAFLWGIVQYITAGADEEKRGAARQLMIYGIIGLFVMVAVWGLVYFVGNLLGINIGSGTALPGVPTPNPVTSV